MNFQQVRSRLNKLNLQVFTTQEFVNVFDLDTASVAVKLTRYRKLGYLESPKRGVYYLKDEVLDKFRIANKIYTPSYISLESVLSKNGIIPETVYSITSITTKATREFFDSQTEYKYYKIKKEAFLGYEKEGESFIATNEKALTDYLYFVSQGKRSLNDRLDLTSINFELVRYYADYFSEKRLDNLIKKLTH